MAALEIEKAPREILRAPYGHLADPSTLQACVDSGPFCGLSRERLVEDSPDVCPRAESGSMFGPAPRGAAPTTKPALGQLFGGHSPCCGSPSVISCQGAL